MCWLGLLVDFQYYFSCILVSIGVNAKISDFGWSLIVDEIVRKQTRRILSFLGYG